MRAAEFYRAVTMDGTDFFGRLLDLLEDEAIGYCLVGGQGVNAYVTPLVSLDLDFAIAARDLDRALGVLGKHFEMKRFANTINLAAAGSGIHAQIQTDPRYFDFVERAERRIVFDREVSVAAIEDLLQGKIWAATDPERRGSKRQKDLADISRIIESYPRLRDRVPTGILDRLEA
jgi:hypothetical protein